VGAPLTAKEADLLNSWKEIAGYLGCEERTCRRWELSLGMPIHRMEGTAKSRVYAYKGELDAWREAKLNGGVGAGSGPQLESEHAPKSNFRGTGPNSGPRREFDHGMGFRPDAARPEFRSNPLIRKLLWLIPAAGVLLAAALFFFRPSPGEPADFKISGSELIVLDGRGKKLWDFDTGLEELISEKEYRGRLQVRTPGPHGRPLLPYLVMKDINRDGRMEVLFAAKTTEEYGEPGLFCFDDRGRKSWHYKPGREHNFGGRVYSGDYRIFGIEPHDINGDGNLEVLLITAHQPHSPSEIIALDCRGKVQGEFVNWGHLHDIAYGDFNGDGKTELAIAGENDEYGKGCLAVFDATRISGSSPQSKDYACRDCGPGSEKYYLVFPRTDVSRVLSPQKEALIAAHLLQNNRLELITDVSDMFFELDFTFKVLDVKGSDYLRDQHRELKTAGKISSVLNNAYWDALKNAVLYWNGTEWTSTPSMNASSGAQKQQGP
jgi:hypothetical protein